LPKPERLDMENVNAALDWILQNRQRTGRCVFQSDVSQAVRVTQAARTRIADLAGVLFIVGSEPLTESKHREIPSAGARVYARYHATEIGTLGIECGCSCGIGDYHLATPRVAVVSDNDRFHFTSLLFTAPKMLINVQLGDTGVIEERECRCLIGGLGLYTRLRQVSSARQATGEGMTVSFRDLTRIEDFAGKSQRNNPNQRRPLFRLLRDRTGAVYGEACFDRGAKLRGEAVIEPLESLSCPICVFPTHLQLRSRHPSANAGIQPDPRGNLCHSSPGRKKQLPIVSDLPALFRATSTGRSRSGKHR
jgi:hypothetical protein